MIDEHRVPEWQIRFLCVVLAVALTAWLGEWLDPPQPCPACPAPLACQEEASQ